MAKKRLNEAVVRRFQKLANLSPINEMYHKRDDEEMEEGMYGNRDDEEVMKEEDALEDEMVPIADTDLDVDQDIDSDQDLNLEMDVEDLKAIINLGAKLEAEVAKMNGVDMDDMGEMGDMDDTDDMDVEEAGEEVAAEVDAEDELMEALRGISYTPSKNEVVNEVAKRVAMRLKSAKLHESKLNRALGRK